MNERIQELAEQCTVSCIDGRGVELNEIDVEKFADLIVRECCQVGGPEDSYTDEWFKAKVNSVAKIRKHFGIE